MSRHLPQRRNTSWTVHYLVRQARAMGYRCAAVAGHGSGCILLGRTAWPGDFTTRAEPGRVVLTPTGLRLAGVVSPAMDSIARASWPLRLEHDRSNA